MAALTGATILSLAKAGDEKEAIKRMPWGVVLMVCGVTVLIGVLEKTQGMSLFTDLLASVSSPATVSAIVAFATGIVSVYSSTSGVVLPAFLPTVPGLVERLGGGDPMAIASSMVVGGHLVDLSPLSTIGALCIAALPARRRFAPAVQPAAGVGHVDDGRRHGRVLGAVLDARRDDAQPRRLLLFAEAGPDREHRAARCSGCAGGSAWRRSTWSSGRSSTCRSSWRCRCGSRSCPASSVESGVGGAVPDHDLRGPAHLHRARRRGDPQGGLRRGHLEPGCLRRDRRWPVGTCSWPGT